MGYFDCLLVSELALESYELRVDQRLSQQEELSQEDYSPILPAPQHVTVAQGRRYPGNAD
jgi:hypothetical protein